MSLSSVGLDFVDAISSFFSSGLWTLFLILFVIFLVVLWFALVYWTYRDARQRFADGGAVNAFTVLSLVMPYLGPVIYLVLRPPEFLADARERELGLEALERESYGAYCPDCGYPIDKDFLACPACLRKLRDPCVRCTRPLDPRWKICPFCETAAPPAMTGSPRSRDDESYYTDE